MGWFIQKDRALAARQQATEQRPVEFVGTLKGVADITGNHIDREVRYPEADGNNRPALHALEAEESSRGVFRLGERHSRH